MQRLPSSQLGGDPPLHVPPPHVSFVVQAFPSLQEVVLSAWAQPVAGLQESSVQRLPSSQEAPLSAWTQPVAGRQESLVQVFPSSHSSDPVPTQAPPLQESEVVQTLSSLQEAVLSAWAQPVAGTQESSVQAFPSSQSRGAPPLHVPPPHVSFAVQAFPSLHVPVLLTWTQPVPGLQESVVQTLPSSQPGALPMQTPPLQASEVVQAFPSSHERALSACTQPVPGLQESSVQMFPSSQSGGGPPLHAPPPQASFVVQAFPSLHEAVLLAWAQPVAGTHESSVQRFPSSQEAVLLTCRQPVAGTQESVVQAFPSSQLGGAVPTQPPPLQVSVVVQAFPSLQETVLLAWAQPVAATQESLVQALPSSQPRGGPPTHAPPLQVSEVVQAFPSLQEIVLLVWVQPVAGTQESLVQALPSSQDAGVQVPPRP